jgi:3-hydroxyacyl-CoA dehydrogenase/enoyl-CoA hydratase/3-hydroxybutyryl-CoA epimerase
MPRLVGIDLGLEVLLQGRNLTGPEAVTAGLTHATVEPGEEVAAAEAWLLSAAAHTTQPWDAPDTPPLPHADYAPAVARERARELARMLGHEPAPLAILDCVEFGLMQPIDGAIRAEMSVFARLIQRPEPRNMIRTMFLGKQACDKAKREGKLAPGVEAMAETVTQLVSVAIDRHPVLLRAGFLGGTSDGKAVQTAISTGYWLQSQSSAKAALQVLADKLEQPYAALTDEGRLQIDFMVSQSGAVPAYLGGVRGLIITGQT